MGIKARIYEISTQTEKKNYFWLVNLLSILFKGFLRIQNFTRLAFVEMTKEDFSISWEEKRKEHEGNEGWVLWGEKIATHFQC